MNYNSGLSIKEDFVYNKPIYEELVSSLSGMSLSKSAILMDLFKQYHEKQNDKIDILKYSSQTILSQMGNLLEQVMLKSCQNSVSKNDNFIISGQEIKNKIIETRRNPQKIKNTTDFLVNHMMMNKAYAEEVISNTTMKLSFPDLIRVHIPTKTILAIEMKSSGQNDSTAVPGNIKKLMFDTSNSAVMGWEDFDKLERSVWIAATNKNKNGTWKNKGVWVNSKNKLDEDISIVCNEDGYTKFTGVEISATEYKELLITVVALQYKRILLTK